MNKQAIVERVARKLGFSVVSIGGVGPLYSEFITTTVSAEPAEAVQQPIICEPLYKVEDVLTAADHFDLLAERDGLRKVVEAAREFNRSYKLVDFRALSRALSELDAVGGGNND